MTHQDIIRTLGGPSAVAKALGKSADVGVKWKRRGIPPAHWFALSSLDAAKRAGITVEKLARAAGKEAA